MKRLFLSVMLLLLVGCETPEPEPAPKPAPSPKQILNINNTSSSETDVDVNIKNYKLALQEINNLKIRIKGLESNKSQKAPIQVVSMDDLLKILQKTKDNKKNISSVEVTKLQARLKKLECDYKQPYNAYRDGVISDISSVLKETAHGINTISNYVGLVTVCIAAFALLIGIFQAVVIWKSKREIAKAMKKQEDRINNDIKDIDKEAKKNKCTTALGFAKVICERKDNDSEKKRSIAELDEFTKLVEFKENFRLFIVKARLQKRIGEYQEAISTIDSFLGNVNYESLSPSQAIKYQIEVFLYNKACYKALLAEKKSLIQNNDTQLEQEATQQNNETIEETVNFVEIARKDEILRLLNQAILLDVEFVESARTDKDFTFIRNNYSEDFNQALQI